MAQDKDKQKGNPAACKTGRKENSTLPYAAGAPQEILTETPRTRQRIYLLHSCITNHCCALLYTEASAYVVEGYKSILGPSHPHQDISVAYCNLYWQLHRKTNNKGDRQAWVKHVQCASLDFLMALSSSMWRGFHMHLLREALQMLSLPWFLSKMGRSQSSKMKYIHVRPGIKRAPAFLKSEPQLGQR